MSNISKMTLRKVYICDTDISSKPTDTGAHWSFSYQLSIYIRFTLQILIAVECARNCTKLYLLRSAHKLGRFQLWKTLGNHDASSEEINVFVVNTLERFWWSLAVKHEILANMNLMPELTFQLFVLKQKVHLAKRNNTHLTGGPVPDAAFPVFKREKRNQE